MKPNDLHLHRLGQAPRLSPNGRFARWKKCGRSTPHLAALVALAIVLCQLGCDRGRSDKTDQQANASVAPAKPEIVPLTNMVLIQPGTFIRAHHRVTLTHKFWLGKFEVTQGEYIAVMGKNPSHFPGDLNRPVEKVSFFDAAAYCAAITKREMQAGHLPSDYVYRLPTEAEWEYACRAGTTNFFSFGDATTEAGQYAWTLENSDATTHPVGQKRPNPWGLYDMHGNVWEWCSDWFEQFPHRDLRDPAGPAHAKFKVFRGGSWNNAIEFARSPNRFMMAPVTGIYFVGFRMALGPVITNENENQPPPPSGNLSNP